MFRLLTLVFVLLISASSTSALADVDVRGQLLNAQAEKQGSDPTGSEARLYWNTGSDVLKVHNGTSWLTFPTYSSKLSVFAATSSSELAGVMSDETGSGALCYATAPTFRTSILLQNASGSQPELLLSEDPDNGTDTVTIKAPASFTAYTLTLPSDDGNSNQVLSTNGSGVLSWASPLSNPMTTTGDIIYSSDGSGTPARLAASTNGKVLTLASGVPAWTATTKGIIESNGSGVWSSTNLWMASVQVSASSDCSGANCSLDVNYGGAFSDVDQTATGRYTANFNSSFWSAAPACTISSNRGADSCCDLNGTPTTSSLPISCTTCSNGADRNDRFTITCMGPRQ